MPSSTSAPGSSESPAALDAERLAPDVRDRLYGRGLARLLIVLFAGPLIWALDLQTAYLLVYRFCHTRNPVPLYLETGVVLAATAFAAWSAWRILAWYPDARLDGGRGDDRARMMAALALGLNVLFLTILAAAAVPRFVLDPCL